MPSLRSISCGLALVLLIGVLPSQSAEGGFIDQCWEKLLRRAGYFGVGRYAFDWQDPRWARTDPGLVRLVGHYSTVYGRAFPSLPEAVDRLSVFSPWKAGESSPRTYYAPNGFPLKAVVVFESGPYGHIRINVDSPLHQQAFATIYAGWLSVMSQEDLELMKVSYSALYDEDLERARNVVELYFYSERQMRRWLELLETELTVPADLERLAQELFGGLADFARAQKLSLGLSDHKEFEQIVNQGHRLSPTLYTHLESFYQRSLETLFEADRAAKEAEDD